MEVITKYCDICKVKSDWLVKFELDLDSYKICNKCSTIIMTECKKLYHKEIVTQ